MVVHRVSSTFPGASRSMLFTFFQSTAALESAASFGTLPARPCAAPLTRLSISKPLPSSLVAPSMMRAEVKYSPVPQEPSTEARSRTLLTIGPPGSRTNVVPDEVPPTQAVRPAATAAQQRLEADADLASLDPHCLSLVRWADRNVASHVGVWHQVARRPLLALAVVLVINTAEASQSLCDQVRSDLSTLRSAVRIYQIEHNGQLPPGEGLQVLNSSGVLDSPSLLLDPWGGPYLLVVEGDDFEIITEGPDHVRGSADDLSSSSLGPCPPWPKPHSNRWLAMPALLMAAISAVGLLTWFLARSRVPKPPRTGLN